MIDTDKLYWCALLIAFTGAAVSPRVAFGGTFIALLVVGAGNHWSF